MRTIIVESGSTKSDWAVCSNGTTARFSTLGLNPRTMNKEALTEIVGTAKEKLLSIVDKQTLRDYNIKFYGAGCGSTEASKSIYKQLSSAFEVTSIEVMSDLMAACHATETSEPVAVGILGTGSNICLWDGVNVIEKPISLGYLMGDEGGGTHIGRLLLRSFIEESMPEELRKLFFNCYRKTATQLVEELYASPAANRFMASFTIFAAQHIHHSWIEQLLINVFNDFFNKQVSRLNSHCNSMYLYGSVAAGFCDIVSTVAEEHGYQLEGICKSPIERLVTKAVRQ